MIEMPHQELDNDVSCIASTSFFLADTTCSPSSLQLLSPALCRHHTLARPCVLRGRIDSSPCPGLLTQARVAPMQCAAIKGTSPVHVVRASGFTVCRSQSIRSPQSSSPRHGRSIQSPQSSCPRHGRSTHHRRVLCVLQSAERALRLGQPRYLVGHAPRELGFGPGAVLKLKIPFVFSFSFKLNSNFKNMYLNI
jgi:hypothetical protein